MAIRPNAWYPSRGSRPTLRNCRQAVPSRLAAAAPATFAVPPVRPSPRWRRGTSRPASMTQELDRAPATPGVGDPGCREILRVEGLHVHFPVRRGLLMRRVGSIKAVDGVDL